MNVNHVDDFDIDSGDPNYMDLNAIVKNRVMNSLKLTIYCFPKCSSI